MISIIVTHKRDVLYLRDCLESIAEQQFKDYETVLVTDHTEDNLDDLIEEFKDRINLKVYELKNGEGVSAARNLGMDMAKGEYIYFLDNDDYLYGDSIKKLLDVMDEDSDMAYGVLKYTWFQRQAFNEKQADEENNDTEEEEEEEQEEEKPKFAFDVPIQYRYQRHKRMDKVTVLSALYKKSLFTDNNIRFNEKQLYYADVLVTTAIMKYAKNIKCCEDSIYVKRHHNDKQNNMALCQYPKVETMPSYFLAYRNAIEMAGENRQLTDHLNVILARFIVKQYIQKVRWPEDERWKNEYFKEISKLAKGINKKALKRIDFTKGEKRLVKAFADGDYDKVCKRTNSFLAVIKLKKMLHSKRSRYKTISLYVFSKLKTKDNWIVFESFMGRNCSGQPKYIYTYLQEHCGSKYKYIWVVDRKGVKIPGKGYTTCRRFGLRYYYYMNRSKYWVNNMRQPLSVPRREDTVMLATWHGTPLKRLVFDMEDVHSASPQYKNTVYKQTRGWDYLLSDNPYSTGKFQSCFLFDREKILEYGYPANDPLYAPNRDEMAAEIKERLGIPADKKVILYAPTWRDDNFYDKGQYGFELDLDINRMEKEFGDEYVLLLRLHYFIVDKLDLSKYGSFTVDGSSYNDVTDLYLISDMLITDYSSVFFDYANLKRPILFFTYDLEKYRDVLRGFYLDMEKDLPGPLVITNDELIDAIKNIDKIQEKYKDRYEEFYNRFCCVDDGNAAKRVVEKVFGES